MVMFYAGGLALGPLFWCFCSGGLLWYGKVLPNRYSQTVFVAASPCPTNYCCRGRKQTIFPTKDPNNEGCYKICVNNKAAPQNGGFAVQKTSHPFWGSDLSVPSPKAPAASRRSPAWDRSVAVPGPAEPGANMLRYQWFNPHVLNKANRQQTEGNKHTHYCISLFVVILFAVSSFLVFAKNALESQDPSVDIGRVLPWAAGP